MHQHCALKIEIFELYACLMVLQKNCVDHRKTFISNAVSIQCHCGICKISSWLKFYEQLKFWKPAFGNAIILGFNLFSVKY